MDGKIVSVIVAMGAFACAGLVTPISGQSVAVGTPPVGRAEAALVTIDVRNEPVERVLRMIARQAGLRMVFPTEQVHANARVTLQVRGVQAKEAFARALAGTGLQAHVADGAVVLSGMSNGASASVAQGSISGKVIDGKTRQGLRGATITIGGTNKRTTSNDDGTFRVSDVGPGSYTLHGRMLGYVKTSKPVMVTEGTTTSIEITMEPSVNALDQVVVTGTVVETERRAIPAAMTVITANEIEQRGIARIDQLFRGDIPGLFAQNQGSSTLLDEVTMFSRGATALSNKSDGTSFSSGQFMFSNPIKTYVDGVELADSKYLSQIDPKSIERIEILTGPQASTVYGSNAINGVMQIFTKRGAARAPQLSVSLLSGWVENNFSAARTPQHDYGAQLNGVEGRLSYNVGGSWSYIGPWTPAKMTEKTGGFGGARLEIFTGRGRVTGDVTLRRNITKNRQFGDAQQTATSFRESGWWTANQSNSGVFSPAISTVTGQTLGFVLGFVPARWWSHEVGVGDDVSETETRYTGRAYRTSSDTTLRLDQNRSDRRSFRYTTTVRIPVSSLAQATVTAGVDSWQNLTTSLVVQPQTLTGAVVGTTDIRRQPGHNTGGFGQMQLGVRDILFLTYGARFEWNPGFGEEAQPNYAPRYGIALTQAFGALTAKLRWSYGRSTRPPKPALRAAVTADVSNVSTWAQYYAPYYNNFESYLANPELAPEHQQGGEGGVEFFVGSRASLIVTRYNQTVDGLIDAPVIDSVRSAIPAPIGYSPDAGGYRYLYQYRYLNVGSIRNSGWETQGSWSAGPITARGTYSWTKSRTLGVDPLYRAFFTPNFYPQYQRGATFRYVPEHTWAFGLTYARAGTTVGMNVTGVGRVMNLTDDFSLRHLGGNIRLSQNRFNVSFPPYVNSNRGYAMADVTASHRLSSRMESVVQIQNLMDHYENDFNAVYATMGRQTKLGVRLRL